MNNLKKIADKMVATSKIYNLRLYEIALEYAEEADHVPVEYADDFNKLTSESDSFKPFLSFY